MKNRRLREAELAVLRATAEALPEDARRILETQVSEVNLVQRHAGGREVNLYRRRLWFWPAEYSVHFPNRSEELPLASVALTLDRGPVEATVWVVRGDLFSVEFSRTLAAKGAVVTRGVSLLEDPLAGGGDRRRGEGPDVPAISALLAIPVDRIHDARPPLAPRRRQLRLELLACEPPADWVQLMRLADGFRVGEATVHGLVALPRAVLSRSTCHVLAEGVDDCFLCLRLEQGEARLVALNHEGMVLEEYEAGFAEALRAYVGRDPAS